MQWGGGQPFYKSSGTTAQHYVFFGGGGQTRNIIYDIPHPSSRVNPFARSDSPPDTHTRHYPTVLDPQVDQVTRYRTLTLLSPWGYLRKKKKSEIAERAMSLQKEKDEYQESPGMSFPDFLRIWPQGLLD